MSDSINDNELGTAVARQPEPDAHGQAAILLVESLLHALIERKILSIEEAVEVVDVAAEVKAEIAMDLGDSPQTMRKSLLLLSAIAGSLNREIGRKT